MKPIKFKTFGKRKEDAFFENFLPYFFPELRIKRQYRVGDFCTKRVDGFSPDFYFFIEYDEKQHDYKYEEDSMRQRKLQDFYKAFFLMENEYSKKIVDTDSNILFPFIRVKEGNELNAIKEIAKVMQRDSLKTLNVEYDAEKMMREIKQKGILIAFEEEKKEEKKAKEKEKEEIKKNNGIRKTKKQI